MGQFSSKTVPCVGVSVGVERVFTVLERQALKQAEELGAGIRESRTQVSARTLLCRAFCCCSVLILRFLTDVLHLNEAVSATCNAAPPWFGHETCPCIQRDGARRQAARAGTGYASPLCVLTLDCSIMQLCAAGEE